MSIGVSGANDVTSKNQDFTISLTTVGTNNIGLLFVENENTSNPTRTVSSINDGTNNWQPLCTLSYGANHGDMEVWWAYIAAAATYTLTIDQSGSIDDVNAAVCYVSGLVDYTDPFDGGFSAQPLASATNNTNTATSVTAAFTTKNAATVVFCFMGAETFSAQGSPPSTWTTLEDEANFNGGLSNGLYVGYKVYSTLQTGTTVTLPNTKEQWGFLVVSLTNASGVSGNPGGAFLIGP